MWTIVRSRASSVKEAAEPGHGRPSRLSFGERQLATIR